MIKIVKGDLLTATEDIIGHQVNCQGVMGSGVAVQIKKKFPIVYQAYKNVVDLEDTNSLMGRCQIVNARNGQYVANLFGQYNYGSRGVYTNTGSLEHALETLLQHAKANNFTVALPYKIGSDRGGADWREVEEIIIDVFGDYGVTLYKYNG